MAHGKTSADPNDFILPDLGEGVHEAELIKWRVKVGDTVAEHDILAEMETDKALVEVPSPRAGVIAALHGAEGEILKVGNPLVTYAGGGESGGGVPARVVESKRSAGESSTRNAAPSPQIAAEREDDGTVVGAVPAAASGVTAEAGKALATPAVRRLARDLGVDINSVVGTGIAGRVTEKDVRAAAGSPPARDRGSARMGDAEMRKSPGTGVTQASPPPPSRRAAALPAGAESVRIPFRGVRRTIASRLRESVSQAVHFNVMDEADVSALDALRRKLAGASGEKVSFLPFVASAVCRVLTASEFRAMNATVEEKPSEPEGESYIVQHRAVHLGIATDTDSGLMVPVIRDADGLGVLEISRHIAQIAAAARSRSIPREQLLGSTFTISNVGSHAGRFATPIINYPEVGILAVGRARPSPVVRGGGIFVGNLLPLSLACDHRVVDGATAALALARIVELLQDPEQLLGPARE
jgi:pyruvate dehydrogenase E2 component (dihydrolipoamide acetyltransferase)